MPLTPNRPLAPSPKGRPTSASAQPRLAPAVAELPQGQGQGQAQALGGAGLVALVPQRRVVQGLSAVRLGA